MPNINELPNYTRLNIAERVYWNRCRADYLYYFAYYSCENADHSDMKATVRDFCEERLSTMGHDSADNVVDKRRFYNWAMEHIEENLDLLMDVYLLDNMWQWYDHDDADRVEFHVMYKHGPY